MKTPAIKLPNPSTAPQSGDDSPLVIIGVKVSILEAPGFAPAGNLIGTFILRQNFNDALKSQNVLLDESTIGVGPLNDSQFIFRVSAAAPALTVLEKILSETNLRKFATLLLYHAGEDCFLPVGPDHANINFGLTLATVGAQNQADHERLLAIIDKAIKTSDRFKALLDSGPKEPPSPS